VGSIIFADLFHLYLIKRRIKPFFHYKYKYLGSMSGSFPLKTVCRGSFHFLLQNERIGLVRSKTSWKWAEYELCLWSAFISWRKPSFSEMSIFSLFSSWKRAFYKFGHRRPLIPIGWTNVQILPRLIWPLTNRKLLHTKTSSKLLNHR
jgi:hypothetical protein